VPYKEALTAAMTPLEYERWVIFGEYPRMRERVMSFSTEDRRDDRDPQAIGREILACPGSETGV